MTVEILELASVYQRKDIKFQVKQFEPHQMILVKETYDKCIVRGHIVYLDTSYDLPRLNKHSKK